MHSSLAVEPQPSDGPLPRSAWYAEAMEHLVQVVQSLSLARDLAAIVEIVRHAARRLTGADGATFVLRDNDYCCYVDEDAVAPLWKGRRFPISACVSGWVMTHRRTAVIPDIFADERVPVDAYRPTFVRSMAIAPIRTIAPLGAIGNYWATPRLPTTEEVSVLQTLADVTAVSMENVNVINNLENLVNERTAALKAMNDSLRHEVALRTQAEETARRLSMTDELTGLYNRRGFFAFAEQQLRLGKRTGQPGWLLYADANDLKLVNDKQGHEAGDRLIVGAARALRKAFRDVDVIGRLGGDEFAAFGLGELHPRQLRGRLADAVAQINQVDELAISLSVGVVACPRDFDQPFEQLLTAADSAMYREKTARRADRAASGSPSA